ncbi:MAG: hypothetical protein ACTSRU_09625 [Candidatus Hodarchaeales archaeon]
MVNTKIAGIATIIITTWVLLFGLSINPLSWGTHAINSIYPEGMLNMTDEQAFLLDQQFIEFNNSLTDFDHEFPADWEFIPQRIELLKLDLFFRDMYGYNSHEDMVLSLSPYNTAANSFGKNDSCSQLLTIANYLIHRGQNAWIYVSLSTAWIEVYIGPGWWSDMEFGESTGLYGEWLIKFNDQVELFSLAPLLFSIITRYVAVFVFISIIQLSIKLLLLGVNDLQESYKRQKESKQRPKDILSYYIAIIIHITKYTVMQSFILIKEVFSGMKEEILILLNRPVTSKKPEIQDIDARSAIIDEDTEVTGRNWTVTLKKLFSLENIIIFAISGLISLLIGGDSVQQIVTRLVVIFVYLKVFKNLVRFVLSRFPFDHAEIVDFVTLDLMTLNFDKRNLFSKTKDTVKIIVRTIINYILITLNFLFKNRIRILLSVASWVLIFFAYWTIIEITLNLLGYQYTAGGRFGHEVMGNLTIINLIVFGLGVGLLSGVTVMIWKSDSKQISNHN